MNFVKRLFSVPLLQFLMIGGLVFGFYAYVQEDAPDSTGREIVITAALAEQLAQQFEATWRRPPSETELERLITAHVREEVLVREAAALSLDQNDAVIRRRLAQKMEFLMEAAAGAAELPEAELRAYFEENKARYATAPQLAFQQVFLGPRPAEDKTQTVLAALQNGGNPQEQGQATLLPGAMPAAFPSAIEATFGRAFAAGILEAKPGVWTGPVASGYGFHLVLVTEVTEPAAPEFEAVQEKVRRDLRLERAGELKAAQIELMSGRYTIVRADRDTGE